MTKLGKMRDLVGNYFRVNSFSPNVSRDLINNMKGFRGDEWWYNPLLMSNT